MHGFVTDYISHQQLIDLYWKAKEKLQSIRTTQDNDTQLMVELIVNHLKMYESQSVIKRKKPDSPVVRQGLFKKIKTQNGATPDSQRLSNDRIEPEKYDRQQAPTQDDIFKCIAKAVIAVNALYNDWPEAEEAILNSNLTILKNNDAPISTNIMGLILAILPCTRITKLHLRHNQLEPEALAMLAKNSTLSSLTLLKNGVDFLAVQAFCENKTITSINLSNNNLQPASIILLARHQHYLSLKINHSFFNRQSIQALADNTQLTSLKLTFCSKPANSLCMLSKNKTLRSLDLSWSPISIEETKTLAKMSLKKLKLAHCGLTPDVVKHIATSPTICNLDISGNFMGNQAAELFATNTVLQTLNIAMNKIDYKGAILFAENTSLCSLDFSSNDIGLKGAQAFSGNSTLQTLRFDPANFHADDKEAVFAALKEPDALKRCSAAKSVGVRLPIPSLRRICFFKIHQIGITRIATTLKDNLNKSIPEQTITLNNDNLYLSPKL